MEHPVVLIIPADDDDPGVGGEPDEDEPDDVGEWHDVEGGAAPPEAVKGRDWEKAAEDGAEWVSRAYNYYHYYYNYYYYGASEVRARKFEVKYISK